MHYTMWRGVAGLVKPTRRPGSLETLIRLLPEGIGVVPLLLNVRQGDHNEFSSAIPFYEKYVAELAENHVHAMRALGIKKFIGASYSALQNRIVIDYMTEAGFKVVSMEPIDVPFNEAQNISPETLYAHIKKLFRDHKGADGIYIQGGAWHTESIVETLEQDLQVPVVHANIAPAWEIM